MLRKKFRTFQKTSTVNKMKIKDIFLIIAVYCATVLPATFIVLGGLIFISSCGDVPSSNEKAYTIRWQNGLNQDQNGVWLSEEELSLGQYQFDPYTGAKFQVISIPAGCKVKAIKAGTEKTFVITVDRYVSKGDTVTWHDGVYYIPK